MIPAPINAYEKWIPNPLQIRGLIGAIASRCREAGCTYQALGDIKPSKVMWPYPTKLPSTLDGFCTHPKVSIPKSRLLDVVTETESWYIQAESSVTPKLVKDVGVMIGKDVSASFSTEHQDANLFLVELLLLIIPSCRSFTMDEKNFYLRVGSTHKTDVVGFLNNQAFGRKVDVSELTKPLTQIEYWTASGFGLMERLWLWIQDNKVRDKTAVLAALASLKATQVADWAVMLDENTFGGLVFDSEQDIKVIQKRRRAKWRGTPNVHFEKKLSVEDMSMQYTLDDYDILRGIMRSDQEFADKFYQFYGYLVPSKLDEKRFKLIFSRVPGKTYTYLQEEKIWQLYVRFEKRLEQFLGLTK